MILRHPFLIGKQAPSQHASGTGENFIGNWRKRLIGGTECISQSRILIQQYKQVVLSGFLEDQLVRLRVV